MYRVGLILAVVSCGAALAQTPQQSDTERLLKIARLWVTVEYFHPYLATRDIGWDESLAETFPAIRDAQDPSNYASAVNKLLAVLGDKQTFAGPENEARAVLEGGAQQSRFHHGLAPADGSASPFYSAILVRPDAAASSVAIDLGLGTVAHVRLSEPVSAQLAKAKVIERLSDDAYPSEAWRFVGAVRLWGAVRYFFAYKDVMGEDWDRVFTDNLPKVLAAKDASSYHLMIAELVSHLSDSNAGAESSTLANYWGEARPPFTIRLVEKKPVVVGVTEAAKQSGINVGDVVTALDGENIVERIKQRANYLSASTPAGLSEAVAQLLLNGPHGSTAKLKIAQRNGAVREIEVKRTKSLLAKPQGEAFRAMGNGVQYVDVTRLEPGQVDAAFANIGASKAVVFDLRGECQVEPNAIASHLTHDARQALLITGPVADAPDLAQPGIETATGSYFFVKRITPGGSSPYEGKVAFLIDARTRGRAEQIGLYIAAATKAQIFGTPSAGSPSETTNVRLPGGILVRFSGEDIRLTNGGAVQREGLQPTESVALTLAAVRAGKDEVLDHAVKALRDESGSMID